MKCANCQTVNTDGARFCINCGSALAIACSNCGAQLQGGAKFCQNCGHSVAAATGPLVASPPVPIPETDSALDGLQRYIPKELLGKLEIARANRSMEGERRIVTVLFCDVKGSTALAEMLDPEEWAEIMNQAFEHLIAPVYRYEGTLARLMGDAILAFFGAPIAHEDDPQRAVLAALDIVEEMRPFRERMKSERNLDFDVRVGINTGLVVVGAVGSDLRMEYTAMGDAVNLASRMEQMAEPGTVQITGSTHKLIASLFEFESLGNIEVKGKSEPVEAYRVLSERKGAVPTRGIEGLSSPLVGRERELNTLLERSDDLIAGQGQIISIMGEAGLGKSRLLAELRKALAIKGFATTKDERRRTNGGNSQQSTIRDPQSKIRWYEGRSLSYETSTPYAPFVDLFNECFGLQLDDTDAEKQRKIKVQIEQIMPGQSGQFSPFIASLLGIKLAGEDLEKVKYLEPPQLRGAIFYAIITYFASLASQQPVVLVFEDLHWTDHTSLDLLEQLATLTESSMLMIIALFRPQQQEPSWRFHELASRDYGHRHTAIALEPLGEQDSRALVANLLEIEDLPEKVRALILRKAEGNPFFVEEVIRSLLDAKLVIREGGHWRATKDIENIAVPDTLAGVITARLDRLDDESKRVAQAASVVGRDFQYDVLTQVYEAPDVLEGSLTNLQERELIREKSRTPLRSYLFKHVLTQETTYSAILMSRRREIHRCVAECLERVAPERVNEIARHFLEAREEGRALPYLVEAADQAAHAYASKEAIGYYRQALDILQRVDNLELARRIYEGLGKALTLTNDIPGALENYHTMLHYAQDHEDAPMSVSAHNKMSFLAMVMGNTQELTNHLVDAERLASEHNDVPGLVEFYTIQCAVCSGAGDFENGAKYLNEAVEVGKKLNKKEHMAFGLTHTTNFQTYMTKFDDAWRTAQQAMQVSEEIGDKAHMAELLGYGYTNHYLMEGNTDEAERVAQKGLDIANQIGLASVEWQGTISLGSLARLRGEYERALKLLEQSHQYAGMSGYPFYDAMSLGILCMTYIDISPKLADKATEYHAQLLGLLQHPPFAGWAGATVWVELGFYELEQGNIDKAAEYFNKGLTTPSTEWLLHRPRYLVGAALVALRRNQPDEAARLALEAKQYAEERNMKYLYPLIALTQGRVSIARNDIVGAMAAFAKAESLAIPMNMRPIIWQAKAAGAQALTTCGRQKEASTKRQEAHDMIDEIAATFQDERLRSLFVENVTEKVQ